ncbi:MAG: bifunctional ornithine acetyltransferase/N-acetylglutamate synthase [Methanomassiliicoccales archaeon]
MDLIEGGITAPKGFLAAGVHCGMKRYRKDLALIYSESPASTSIAYTQNKVKGAPLKVMMDRDPRYLKAFVINSGNANTLTGKRGVEDALDMINQTSSALQVEEGMVGVVSTGLIGRFLPMDKIGWGIEEAARQLGRGRKYDSDAGEAIMTTDTAVKEAACRATLQDGTRITVGGMAKGSGMISPAMRTLHATTLSFMTTDASLSAGFDGRWQEVMDASFNMINVDGDQSTNDMSVLMANGMAGGEHADEDPVFWEAVRTVAKSLAKQVASDGEGATKLIEVTVKGALSENDARLAARAVVNSNLVKSAIFGADPNYGRILAAVGASGAEMDPGLVDLSMGGNGSTVSIFQRGEPLLQAGDKEDHTLQDLMKGKVITITVDLGMGEHSAEAWGCDLSYDYVRINAEYTT